MSTLSRRRKSGNGKAAALDRYKVKMIPVHRIIPSPENDDIYGEVDHDEEMDALISSIRRLGLEEPILLTKDHYVLSGHRRLFACKFLGWDEVPCRITATTRAGNDQYHRDLADYNPQRVKGVGALLKEALLRDESPSDTYAAIEEYHAAQLQVEVEFMRVRGVKSVPDVSDKKRPFLERVQAVVNSLRKYWPLSIRQVHYNLLNNPPLISTPKRSTKDQESYRYRNDKASYNALVRLLTSARYHGHVSMTCIDDPTRPQITHHGWPSVNEFVRCEIDGFLAGYSVHRQHDQPRHIEILGEKNTLLSMLRAVADEYYVPLSLGRGYCSIPVWHKIANRFEASGKKAMTLIVVSDFDPDGLELADDAIRSLRDLWGLPIEGHRIAVTREQIDDLQLAEDFNPAKESSTRYASFVERTGDTKTWEVEALPPDYLVEQVKAAVEANMDMDIFRNVVESEERDAGRLWQIKQDIAGQMQF